MSVEQVIVRNTLDKCLFLLLCQTIFIIFLYLFTFSLICLIFNNFNTLVCNLLIQLLLHFKRTHHLLYLLQPKHQLVSPHLLHHVQPCLLSLPYWMLLQFAFQTLNLLVAYLVLIVTTVAGGTGLFCLAEEILSQSIYSA